MKSNQLKLVAASVGGLALVAMGAVTVVYSDAPGNISEGISLTLGETTTSTTAPTQVKTSVATPLVTASTPQGFSSGTT